jgi:hypothetical protein
MVSTRPAESRRPTAPKDLSGVAATILKPKRKKKAVPTKKTASKTGKNAVLSKSKSAPKKTPSKAPKKRSISRKFELIIETQTTLETSDDEVHAPEASDSLGQHSMVAAETSENEPCPLPQSVRIEIICMRAGKQVKVGDKSNMNPDKTFDEVTNHITTIVRQLSKSDPAQEEVIIEWKWEKGKREESAKQKKALPFSSLQYERNWEALQEVLREANIVPLKTMSNMELIFKATMVPRLTEDNDVEVIGEEEESTGRNVQIFNVVTKNRLQLHDN